MRIRVFGSGDLAAVFEQAAVRRGFSTGDDDYVLAIIAQEVNDHQNLDALNRLTELVLNEARRLPIVVTSQVAPGWSRQWTADNLYYQPHTLIRGHEVLMAYAPNHIVVGCAEPLQPLPGPYVKYLSAFECPVHRMGYESAELSKLALNYILGATIRAAADLAQVAISVGADWDDIEPVIRLDPRIGPHAYIRPGDVGGHLPRDVTTINRLRALH